MINRNFSHIYIEEKALEYPDTATVLTHFPQATQIPITDYKTVFNRGGQRFQSQKRSAKIILAVKKNAFLYDGSRYAPNFDLPNFYYNSMMLNCVYNCDYCYLQGMYPSGNIVIFVNTEPFFAAADEVLRDKGSIYLCISYDTDLLAFENVIPNCRRWIEWAETRPNSLVELRTKSTNFSAISDMPPAKNTILAWTLSPGSVTATHEFKTPSLDSRLASVVDALNSGWRVRICIDPILNVPDWIKVYSEFIDGVLDCIPGEAVHDFSLGVFRMNSEYLDRIRTDRKDSKILFHPFVAKNKSCSYDDVTKEKMTSVVKERILARLPSATVSCQSGS